MMVAMPLVCANMDSGSATSQGMGCVIFSSCPSGSFITSFVLKEKLAAYM
jgi:hypothetical protein